MISTRMEKISLSWNDTRKYLKDWQKESSREQASNLLSPTWGSGERNVCEVTLGGKLMVERERMMAYPVVITKDGPDYLVYIPAFNIDTAGKSIADAIEMARDAIGLVGIEFEDEGKKLPDPLEGEIVKEKEDDIVTYVDIDFDEYRMKHDTRKVRKNVTIPYYLNIKAEKIGLNFSRILEEALMEKLNC